MIPIRIGTMATQAIARQFFTIKIDTAITGSGTVSSTNQFQLPALGTYRVNWGDGTRQTITALNDSSYVTHTYASPGIYFVSVAWSNSAIKRIWFNNSGDRNKLLDITQWGETVWTSMEGAFRGCTNLSASFLDVPRLQLVTSMANMFDGAANFNTDIGAWDTSSVTNMSYLFRNAADFNQNIGSWDVSAVTDMSNMFDGCTTFNQNIGSWNTAATTNMSGMFFAAAAFNQNIGSWDTTAVTNMSDMFRSATAFNQNIGSWITTAVTNMSGMFRNADVFNQNIGSWDTAAVTNMTGMFKETLVFNQNIGSWNTAAVTDMSEMFSFTTVFNQDISGWDTSSVTNMFSMFRNALDFDQSIGTWDVSSVTNMSNMFTNAEAFDRDVGNWNVGTVTNFVDFMANRLAADFLATNLDAIYNGWTNYELQIARSISFGSVKYTAAGTEGKALLTRADATVSVTNAQNNGSGLIRITATAHGLSTGNKIYIKNVGGTTEANGAWIVTYIDADTVDLQSSTFTNAYTSGGTLRTGYGWSVIDGGI